MALLKCWAHSERVVELLHHPLRFKPLCLRSALGQPAEWNEVFSIQTNSVKCFNMLELVNPRKMCIWLSFSPLALGFLYNIRRGKTNSSELTTASPTSETLRGALAQQPGPAAQAQTRGPLWGKVSHRDPLFWGDSKTLWKEGGLLTHHIWLCQGSLGHLVVGRVCSRHVDWFPW